VELDSFQCTDKSLMPEGLEKDLAKPQDLADLIAYVQADHPPRKEFPGNRPEVAQAESSGELKLPASICELFGPEIRYYQADRAIGDWHTAADQAVWHMEVAESGEYDVWLEWSCADHTAGNGFRIEAPSGAIEGKVGGTKQWTTFRREKVGVLTLAAGPQSLVVRSDGEVKVQALFDVRSITLTPTKAAKAPRKPEPAGN
jgi:hypothetical protein